MFESNLPNRLLFFAISCLFLSACSVVGGLHVWGGSALSEMVLEHDWYRSFTDTYVRGARVIALDEHKDGSFQASVEM